MSNVGYTNSSSGGASANIEPSDGGGGGNTNPDNPEVTWWCRILTKVAGAIAAVVALICGLILCVTSIVSPLCFVSGIIQMLAAVVMLIFEAPFCCQFLEFTRPVASFADRRTFLQKAFIYGGMSIPPVFMCFGAFTLVGCGLMFAVGVIYGLLALGRKADRATMMARAAGEEDKIEIVPHDQLRH